MGTVGKGIAAEIGEMTARCEPVVLVHCAEAGCLERSFRGIPASMSSRESCKCVPLGEQEM